MSNYRKIDFGKRYENASLSSLMFSDDECKKILDWIKKPYWQKRMLLVLGEPGTGKTYFAAALVEFFEKQKYNFRYYTDASFIGALKKVMQEGHDVKYEIERLSESADIFILDDLGSIRLTEWEIEQIHALVDSRYCKMTPLVIISNFAYEKFREKFEPRFVSRIFARENTIVSVKGRDLRQEGY